MTAAAATSGPKLTGAIRDVETFACCTVPGDKPGETWTYSDAHLKEIADNFKLLSTGDNPLHAVPLAETHTDKVAVGWVPNLKTRGDVLLTDFDKLHPDTEKAIYDGRYRKVSAEIKENFTDRHGKVYPGKYLYRVAVLGKDPPRIKGLADIPVNKFADEAPGVVVERELKFADPPPPPHAPPGATPQGQGQPASPELQAAITYLQSKGVKTADALAGGSPLDANTAQQLIIETAAAWQAESKKGTDAMPPTTTTATQTHSDPAADVTRLFADAEKRFHDLIADGTKKLADATAAAQQAADTRAAEERVTSTRLFCDRMAKENRLAPAENDEANAASARARLVRLARQPQQTTHKFADPSDATGKKQIELTELQLQQQEIEQRQPRRFAEKAAATGGQQQNRDGSGRYSGNDGKGGNGATVDPFTATGDADFDAKTLQRFEQRRARSDRLANRN